MSPDFDSVLRRNQYTIVIFQTYIKITEESTVVFLTYTTANEVPYYQK
jgi:hypothetical protein